MSYELLTPSQVELAKWKTRIHGVKPLPNNLYFTKAWADKGFAWCGDKYFEIKRSVVVPYSASYILPTNDYKDIDLSNATAAIKLYPEAEGRAYEILLGLKPGNYHVILYIPTGSYLLGLGDKAMYPDVADADKRYLGIVTPEDSPAEDPTVKLWAIKEYDPWVARVYILDGAGFEKAALEFKVIKHDLKKLDVPPANFTEIKHHSEITGIW